MKNLLVLCFTLFGITNLYSQNQSSSKDADKVYTTVQTKPQFPGDINKYLADHISYPEDAKKNNVQGTVYISFVVEKDGSVSGVTALRKVNPSLDAEAISVISSSPKWKPGMQDGMPVRVQYTVPVQYTLVK